MGRRLCTSIVVSALVLVAAMPAGAADGGTVVWLANEPPGSERPDAILVSPDGSRIYVGGTATTIAFDAVTGATLWRTAAGGPMALSPDGAKLFVGWNGVTTLDTMSGTVLWSSPLDDSASRVTALAPGPDGTRLFATGWTPASVSADFATAAFDAAAGTRLWYQRFDAGFGTGKDVSRAIAVAPDGVRVFVAGESVGFGGVMATIAYLASDGTPLWLERDGGNYARVEGIQVAPDSQRVYVAGTSDINPGPGAVVIAHDAVFGRELWSHWTNGYGDAAGGFAMSPDGSRLYVAATGYRGVYVPPHNYALYASIDYVTIALDAVTGLELWEAVYDGVRRRATDRAKAIAVSSDGYEVYVTGESQTHPYAPPDYATVAYSSAGVPLWEARYDGAGRLDSASTVAGGLDGTRVFVSGWSVDAGNVATWTTISLDTGTLSGIRRSVTALLP